MSDYDFNPLNDKEFEILCCDLVGAVEGQRFERFKPGKDGGVDGRFFSDSEREVVLQCKHWSNTPLAQLLHALRKDEKPKLEKLKPHRYILAISNPLSRTDKESILSILSPHLKVVSDIYGREDLNDILRRNSQIEKRHYKLWLHSAAVLGQVFNNAILGRSGFSLEEIVRYSSRYVVTKNHEAALKVLERLGVVIITGEPGVGKTTLADHLCLRYVVEGFEYLKIADDIREAESAFEPDAEQIFYFDDFLGRNYLDALRGNEGSHITQFIRRVAADKKKRFVLTSRSTILNQGKFLIDSLEHGNTDRNEYELRIQSFTELDKAQILYNHIWHSGLAPAYIEEIYVNRRYREIIGHKNFNPRLISYVTDATRLESCSPANYWKYILGSLSYPSQVWENPFLAQQDDFCRAIVFLVVLNGHSLSENVLGRAYHRYIALPENGSLRGRREFQSNIRLLTGSFLNRSVSEGISPVIDLFNPSIGDYVLERYGRDETMLLLGILSLRTTLSLVTLRSLKNSRRIGGAQALGISYAIVKYVLKTNFDDFDVRFVAWLFDSYLFFSEGKCVDSGAVTRAVNFLLGHEAEMSEETIGLVEWGVKNNVVAPDASIKFVMTNFETISSDAEIRATWSLLAAIPESAPGYETCVNSVKEYVLNMVSENLAEFVDVNDAFARVDYGEDWLAVEQLEKLLERKLDDLGVRFATRDVSEIVGSYDVAHELHRYYERSIRDGDWEPDAPVALAIDQIDDLFDRG